MGFSASLNAIVANLPKQRQTLLFSATQTKSVKDLARLSLKDPEYVAVREGLSKGKEKEQDGGDEEAKMATPKNLEQHYMVVPLNEKLDVLWSFIKTHLFTKTIVFLSSGKQVSGEESRLARSGRAVRKRSNEAIPVDRFASFMKTSATCDLECHCCICTANRSRLSASRSTSGSSRLSTRSCSPRISPLEVWTFLQ